MKYFLILFFTFIFSALANDADFETHLVTGLDAELQARFGHLEIADLEKEAEKGDVGARYSLGMAYLNRKIVPRNEAEAFKHFVISAEGNYRPAIFQRGFMSYTGIGTQENYKQAFKDFETVASTGKEDMYTAKANHFMGLMYDKGRGVSENKREAFKLFKAASDMGYIPASHVAGEFLARGIGVAKNVKQAIKHLKKAVKGGYERSRGILLDLEYNEQKPGQNFAHNRRNSSFNPHKRHRQNKNKHLKGGSDCGKTFKGKQHSSRY